MIARLKYILELAICSFLTRFILLLNTHHIPKHVNSVGGVPIFRIKGKFQMDQQSKVTFVNNASWSTLGVSRRCKLTVYEKAELVLKGRLGISNTVIVATKRIEIGDNVMIGGGVTIIDSDFHSMDYHDWFTDNDAREMHSSPVIIGDNVFIGMNTIILKGVHIGDGAIIGAGSVVSKNIPSNEIWCGNPAKFVKRRK